MAVFSLGEYQVIHCVRPFLEYESYLGQEFNWELVEHQSVLENAAVHKHCYFVSQVVVKHAVHFVLFDLVKLLLLPLVLQVPYYLQPQLLRDALLLHELINVLHSLLVL